MSRHLVISQAAIRAFCHAHSVRQMAIFGSALRDAFRPDSDIDVLIDLAPNAHVGLPGLERMRGANLHIRHAVLAEAQTIHAE